MNERRKKYGFFGGSFNPPTIAHIDLAKQVRDNFKLDCVFFVPVGDGYEKKGLIQAKHRLQMLKIACENQNNLEVLDLETRDEKRRNTIEAFSLIQKKYGKEDLFYIMGQDNFEKMPNWDFAEELIKNFKFIIIKRGNKSIRNSINQNKLLKKYQNNFYFNEDQIQNNYSSTIARNAIKENNMDILTKVVDYKVIDYIKKYDLY